MVLSEGRHEIETARQRLTAAKAQATAAAKMMESAQLMSDAAKKEVLAASEGLKKAEERWDVINVDIEDDIATSNTNNEGNNKRRKVSVSPQGSNANSSNNNTFREGEGGELVYEIRRMQRIIDPNSVYSHNRTSRNLSNTSSNIETSRNPGQSTTQNGNNLFQTAVDQHRDNTVSLLKESAQRGESQIPVNKMEEARNKYLSAARAVPILISEVYLKGKMAEAEKEATSMYLQQIQRSKARTISSRVAAGSTARTTQSNNNNNPSTPATQTVLPKKKTELLLARIKKLVSMWAEEEQMKGINVFYWNIMSSVKVTNVSNKVPTSIDQLASCDLSQNFIQQYGERLIKNINAFIEQEKLQAYI